jgi:hypothetical protein
MMCGVAGNSRTKTLDEGKLNFFAGFSQDNRQISLYFAGKKAICWFNCL